MKRRTEAYSTPATENPAAEQASMHVLAVTGVTTLVAVVGRTRAAAESLVGVSPREIAPSWNKTYTKHPFEDQSLYVLITAGAAGKSVPPYW